LEEQGNHDLESPPVLQVHQGAAGQKHAEARDARLQQNPVVRIFPFEVLVDSKVLRLEVSVSKSLLVSAQQEESPEGEGNYDEKRSEHQDVVDCFAGVCPSHPHSLGQAADNKDDVRLVEAPVDAVPDQQVSCL
jgi:hypothetical protein